MQTEHLAITGMVCGSCVQTVRRALETVGGVSSVDISLDKATATVRFDERATSVARLSQAIEGAGYGVGMPDARDVVTANKGCCG